MPRQPARGRNGLDAIGRLAHHSDVGFGRQDEPQPRPDHGLVVGDQDVDHEASSAVAKGAGGFDMGSGPGIRVIRMTDTAWDGVPPTPQH